MPVGSISYLGSLGGISINGTLTRSGTGYLPGQEVSLPAAKAGTLSTRTDDDTGILTVESGHGITDTDTVDVFWSGGVRYGVDVTATTATTIEIDAGSGDNLPTVDSAITVAKLVEIDIDFDGDNLELIVALSNLRAHLDFQDSTPTSLEVVELTANEPWIWAADTSITNPLTGNPVDTIQAANGDSSAAATLKLGGIYNST